MNFANIFRLLSLSTLIAVSHSLIDGLFCGARNCYHVLGLRQGASKSEISHAFRSLTRLYNPKKRVIGDGSGTTYESVLQAYNILTVDVMRKAHDHMLEYPDSVMYHYFLHYYRLFNQRFSPNFNVIGFVCIFIIIVSTIQYLYHKYTFTEAVKYAMKKLRNHYMQLIEHDEILMEMKKKIKNKKSKEEYKREEERALLDMAEITVIEDGVYSKPELRDLLIVHAAKSPYYFVCYMRWLVNWYWRFNYCGEPYGDIEKEYLTRKCIGLWKNDWNNIDNKEKETYMKKELWVAENKLKYIEEIKLERMINDGDGVGKTIDMNYVKKFYIEKLELVKPYFIKLRKFFKRIFLRFTKKEKRT